MASSSSGSATTWSQTGAAPETGTRARLHRCPSEVSKARTELVPAPPPEVAADTGTSLITWLVPDPFVAMSATRCVPAVAKVCVGDCRVEVAPSSKIQSQLVAWGELVSVKVTGLPARAAENVKLATGGASEYVTLETSGP